MAIVIEVPTQSIGAPASTVRAWVTVSLCGHAPEVQVSRWGLPEMTHIFITDPASQDDYNRSRPSEDVPRFSQIVAEALPRVIQLAGSTGDPAAYAQRVVERLFPTTLPYVLDTAASFGFAGFNGRATDGQRENVMLSLQANTPIDKRATVPRTNILDPFPYFGAPHPDPIRRLIRAGLTGVFRERLQARLRQPSSEPGDRRLTPIWRITQRAS